MKKVADIIRGRIEDTKVQNAIVAFLRPYNGKRIDVRLIAKLNEAVPGFGITLHKEHGAWLYWGGYGMSQSYREWNFPGKPEGGILIARRVKNLTVDIDFILEQNVGYFSAAEAKNQRREALLSDTARLEEIDATIAQFVELRDRLKQMLSGVEDHWAIEQENNLNFEKKK